MQDNINTIIIGDVHGRTFWKDAMQYGSTPVVFVGDYLDPYTSIEGITHDEAIDNFKEIIAYARSNTNVHLLYGNHDSYAFKSTALCSVRHNWNRYEEICEIYDKDKDLFRMAYDFSAGGKTFLVTHAGINPRWIRKFGNELYGEGYSLNAETINKPMETEFPYGGRKGFEYLCRINWKRGGIDDESSFLWSDFTEHLDYAAYSHDEIPKDMVQIFGHTWLKKAICIEGSYTFACIDCNRAVYVDNDGVIRHLDDGTEIQHSKLQVAP